MKEPKIRFNGFEGEWEETTLAELGKFYSGIGFPENEQGGKVGIPFFKVSDMNNIGNEKVMQTSNNYVTYNQVKKNCWKICSDVPAIYFAKVGAAVLLNRKRLVLNQCLCDNNTLLYSFDKKVWDTWFCLSYFETIDLTKLVQVGTLPSCNSSMVGKIIISLPSLAEQQSIASFFSTIDAQISASTSRLASLKQIKAASLQAMFPQEGETVPKLRFKGFEGEWEEVSLADIGKCYSGFGFPEKEQGGLNGIPFYKVSDMNNKGNYTIMSNSNNYVTIEQVERNGWKICTAVPAIYFAKVGAAVLLNRKRLVLNPCLCDNNTMLYSFDKSVWDTWFCKTCFDRIDLSKLVQIGTLPSYNGFLVGKIKVLLPTLHEQKVIGAYFTNLDRQITLQSQRLEKLKQIKAACLDKMFV